MFHGSVISVGKDPGTRPTFFLYVIYLQCDKDTGYGNITWTVKGIKMTPGSMSFLYPLIISIIFPDAQ